MSALVRAGQRDSVKNLTDEMLKSGRVLRHRRESILGVHDCQRSVLLEGSCVVAKLVQQTAEGPDI